MLEKIKQLLKRFSMWRTARKFGKKQSTKPKPKTIKEAYPRLEERHRATSPGIRVQRAGSTITNYGKFFKGKGTHQSKSYRRSTMAHERPEDD